MKPNAPIIALQLFSIRQVGSLEEQLSAAARAGIQAVEVLEEHLAQPLELKRCLDEHQLIAPSAHISFETIKNGQSRILDACKSCNITQLFVPSVAGLLQIDTTNDWQRLGEQMGALADTLDRNGITFGFHNNDVGFSLLGSGRYGFEVLFNAARGSALKWQADIAWLQRAGMEPVEWMKRYRSVLVSAHVKDLAPTGSNADEDGWSDIGSGVLTWPSLWKTALDNGARSLVLEHDNPKEPIEFAKRSFAYVSRFNTSQPVKPPVR
ncbi:sugar phosphate isomerase/epimerase [Rhizobium sp. RCAM05973]|uniref:sugar phosphate isomerase/epimerase family protein n=1 Tax=Rhizobium sp. RCAM05973 TaxID=2994066 RepID=UPI0022EBB9E8|nr:sugar phosphate isomerase/epimerase [Rhizobium sp. RCAM05973]